MISIGQFINKLRTVDIVKVFSLNAIATLVRMMAGLISVKVVASIIGPSGVAMVGQLNNLVSIALGIATGGVGGVTKYVAEYREDSTMIKKLLSNALRIVLVCTLVLAMVLIIGHDYFSRYVMLSDEYGYVFVIFGITIIFYALNGLLVAILNGYKQFKKYVVVNISGTIFGLLFSISLVLLWGLKGALINIVTFQSFVFFVTLWMVRKETWFVKDNFNGELDKETVIMFLKFSSMTILPLFLVPISQMLLRGYVISQISMDEAGWWDGMNKISQMYLGVITTSLSVYYLPKLSETKNVHDLRAEIFRVYKFMSPVLFVGISIIFIFRHLIVSLLYTPAFYPMENLFVYQLLGDFFKVMSWILAYQMVAKSQIKLFMFSEVSFTLSNLLLSFLLVRLNGIVGLTQGYMINYMLYSLFMVVIYRKILFNNYD